MNNQPASGHGSSGMARQTKASNATDNNTTKADSPQAPGAGNSTSGDGMPLPHERDQSHNDVSNKPPEVIAQAKRDLDAGLVDTDMRSTPGLDAERRQQLVPGTPPHKAPADASETDKSAVVAHGGQR